MGLIMNRLCVVFLLLVLLSGCGPYQLRGLVVQGKTPGIEVVDKNDSRLDQPGLPSANIDVLLDPDRFDPKRIGQGQSGRAGSFSLPISESGAGFLILDVEVKVSRELYQSVSERLELPGSGKRLLVTLKAGNDISPIENPNVLEETLRDAEPYLRNTPN